MYKELSEVLICPECMGELTLSVTKEDNGEVIEGKLSCSNKHNWIIKEGVIHFGSEEQDLINNWEEMYKQADYEELDKEILNIIPENMKRINNMTKDIIVNKLSEKDVKVILDVATGRGMLLTEIAKKLTTDVQVICADLSFEVLKYDRLKVKKINPNIRVNFIACDATRLPLKEASVDLAVSFYGIANMMDKIPSGIAEVKKVLKDGKFLLNSGIIIKENSTGYKKMKELLNSQEIYKVEKLFTEIGFKDVHKAAGFQFTDMITVAEDIGDKCEIDLLPFEGEWFSVVIAECKK